MSDDDDAIKASDKIEKTDDSRAWRLERILELKTEGFSDEGIAAQIGIDALSVKGIYQKHLRDVDDRPPSFWSSLASSFANHPIEDHMVKPIENIRVAADELCALLDRHTPQSREASLAKTHLEEVVMWAVKSIVLPRNPN